ncbi:adenylate/guanylate cyclase domain-containing protein [Oculatella sp. LEGE 06141]|nr:adenylate cyclase [Oculatella sp. LEGE 06141]MBE9180840.1 adenylate/guanylate cyclase domain-containing protein [Oculatella sp. LEGE 06141]
MARLQALQTQWRQAQTFPEFPAYQQWRRRFLQHRLRLGLRIAIIAYLTFIILDLLRTVTNPDRWDPTWITMAISAEIGLVLCLILRHSPMGKQRPELIFLGASWSVTLVEQVWATSRGVAFPGLFAWTLVFLTQATILPLRWSLHLASQIGVLLYYYGINTLLELTPADQPLWDASQVLYLFWFCGICDLSVFLYERLQQSEFQARRELEIEQQKSEQLLLNILPAAVAKQLKQEHRTIAESFSDVTVLFADIVDFTRLSAGIPPDEMVDLLNQIFSAFDQLADRHNLEKIKTIGDAYMVVGGLPVERADHIEAIADMALDMQTTMTRFTTRQNQALHIRIGINSGPVVAGVIGTKKFIYDLWGDTVNVASRMESQGLAGRIQVTETAYLKLKKHYWLEPRGSIEVKGKGAMMTYLLCGKR